MKNKYILLVIMLTPLFLPNPCYAGFLDRIMNLLDSAVPEKLDENTIISGLKEAISVGTNNAVSSVSKIDGYFKNPSIKIPIPEKIEKVADGLRKFGYQKLVDDFIISMNRSAEKAALKATPIFIDAIKEMTFEDAKKILNGSETAATSYFKEKTNDKIYDVFKPVIASSMDETGATRAYKNITGKFASLPFVKPEFLEIDRYVTNKALEGLFFVIGQEEKKIRNDPAARISELLIKVFGK